jgi:hypothetical protein
VSPPGKRSAGGELNPAGAVNNTNLSAAATAKLHDAADRSARAANRQSIITVPALAFPPCARRRLWLLLVPSCPLCDGVHAHRGARHGGVRRSGCDRGEYLVRIRVARR